QLETLKLFFSMLRASHGLGRLSSTGSFPRYYVLFVAKLYYVSGLRQKASKPSSRALSLIQVMEACNRDVSMPESATCRVNAMLPAYLATKFFAQCMKRLISFNTVGLQPFIQRLKFPLTPIMGISSIRTRRNSTFDH